MSEELATQNQGMDLVINDDLVGTKERPQSLDRNDRTGSEDIGIDELRLPRLLMAQGLSPQVTPGESKFIEGLTLFQMFNDATNEIYGKGPLTFVPLRREVKRIEFRPRSEGGGVLDLDVPKGDVRLKWTKSDPSLTRADLAPAATEFQEFVVMLIRKGKPLEPVVFSIAAKNKWNNEAIKKLLWVIKLRPPIYSNLFSVDTIAPGKNDKGTFAVPTIRDLGYIPKDTPQGSMIFDACKKFADSIEGKVLTHDREPGDDDVPFDPNAIETEGKTEM